MKVLLSNDDNIYAVGIRSLYRALVEAGHEVIVVAPATEQSGVSSAVTSRGPLLTRSVDEADFHGVAVSGTPADCVMLALHGIIPDDQRPDLVMTGINKGPNSGMDLLFSGTVGAAIQGALAGVPSIAVSNADASSDSAEVAKIAVKLAEKLMKLSLPEGVVYNLNFPRCNPADIKGVKICPHGTKWNLSRFEKRLDPDGKPYWWWTEKQKLFHSPANGPDKRWLYESYITLTALRPDFNDEAAREAVRSLGELEDC